MCSDPQVATPLLSLVLLALWLLLNNSASPGQLILGALFGLLIPLFTSRFWPEPAYVTAPGWHFSIYGARAVGHYRQANFAVARVVLGPGNAIQPVFVRVPLDVEGEFATTVLPG